MTTSSEHRSNSSPLPDGEHWSELTATLTPASTDSFGDWLSEELTSLVDGLEVYVTPNSRRKSLSR